VNGTAPQPDGPPTVWQAFAAAKAAISPVGKDSTNTQQHFKFRGVDAVVNAAAPALNKQGIVIVPKLKTVTYSTEEVGQKRTVMANVRVTVRYRFAGPAGDFFDVTVPGEAMDSGDKGVAKAMSVAYRIALIQALNLPTGDPEVDENSYERSPRQPQSAAEAFENAAPVRDPLAEYTASAVSFATEDKGRELWRAVAASAKARDITREDAKHLQDTIQARIADLRDDAAKSASAEPVEGVIVEGLDPGDEWAAKVESITGQDDADAAMADARKGIEAGRISADRGEAILAAIGTRLVSLAGTGAAA